MGEIQVALAVIPLIIAAIVLVRRSLEQKATGDADALALTRQKLVVVAGGAVIVAIGIGVLSPDLFG